MFSGVTLCATKAGDTEKSKCDLLSMQDQGEFDWSPTVQSAISSSFYWSYILSQVVGGVLTQYFGTKTVFGGSQLVTAICSLLMPSAAGIHYGAMIALRSIQGIASVSFFGESVPKRGLEDVTIIHFEIQEIMDKINLYCHHSFWGVSKLELLNSFDLS